MAASTMSGTPQPLHFKPGDVVDFVCGPGPGPDAVIPKAKCERIDYGYVVQEVRDTPHGLGVVLVGGGGVWLASAFVRRAPGRALRTAPDPLASIADLAQMVAERDEEIVRLREALKAERERTTGVVDRLLLEAMKPKGRFATPEGFVRWGTVQSAIRAEIREGKPMSEDAMRFIHACDCGHEQEVTEAETCPAAVVRCEGCRQVWGCVRTRYGQPVWVRISEDEVEFHQIMKEPEDAE
jgi:hypothetical protein